MSDKSRQNSGDIERSIRDGVDLLSSDQQRRREFISKVVDYIEQEDESTARRWASESLTDRDEMILRALRA